MKGAESIQKIWSSVIFNVNKKNKNNKASFGTFKRCSQSKTYLTAEEIL